MQNIFGEKLRTLRMDAGLGLRELARHIDKSPGYISDVENGRVKPPSETIIIKISEILHVDKNELLTSAKKIDPELTGYVAEDPHVADFLRMAKEKDYKDGDWERLKQLAEIANLGGIKKERE